jgi:ribonuclease-3
MYLVVEISGDPHNPKFRVECRVADLEQPTYGEDNSRRKAEQKAADLALKGLLNGKK